MTPRELEPFIGSRARVSEVLSGKRPLSIEMIRSLHDGLGIPYESLISKRAPTADAASASAPALHRLNELGVDFPAVEVAALMAAARPAQYAALHRKTRTQRAALKTDQTSLMLWQAAVLKKSEEQRLSKHYEPSSFKREALRRLARLSARADGPECAMSALAELGISTVVFPSLPGTFLDGAAMISPAGRPVIALTLRHDRTDSFWFTLLHEASHISLHFDHLQDSQTAFVDDMEIRSTDMFEEEADDLARESLIPAEFLSQICWDKDTTHDDLISLSVRARVHIAVVAGRWQRDHQNYQKFSRLIERGTLRPRLAPSHFAN